MYKRL